LLGEHKGNKPDKDSYFVPISSKGIIPVITAQTRGTTAEEKAAVSLLSKGQNAQVTGIFSRASISNGMCMIIIEDAIFAPL